MGALEILFIIIIHFTIILVNGMFWLGYHVLCLSEIKFPKKRMGGGGGGVNLASDPADIKII